MTHAPRPRAKPAIRMQWADLLFVHWRVDADRLQRLVPDPVKIETFDGSAWIGLVPFTMPVVRPWFAPPVDVTGLTRFHECNVRTYATLEGERGVWFFSLDAASAPAVWWARAFWHLAYHRARISLEREGDVVRYAVQRRGAADARLRCSWQVGEARPPSEPGDLAHFLTERYLLFSVHGDRACHGRIWHDPWPLRDAELLELDDGLVAAAGVDGLEGDPIVMAADPIDVDGWPLQRVR